MLPTLHRTDNRSLEDGTRRPGRERVDSVSRRFRQRRWCTPRGSGRGCGAGARRKPKRHVASPAMSWSPIRTGRRWPRPASTTGEGLALAGADGRGPGGWYSWDWVDNDGEPSADRIEPEWQDLDVGQHLYRAPGLTNWWTVVIVEPNRTLVMQTSYGLLGRSFDPRTDAVPWASTLGTWAFYLNEALDGRTRLVVRRGTAAARRCSPCLSPSWWGNPCISSCRLASSTTCALGSSRGQQPPDGRRSQGRETGWRDRPAGAPQPVERRNFDHHDRGAVVSERVVPAAGDRVEPEPGRGPGAGGSLGLGPARGPRCAPSSRVGGPNPALCGPMRKSESPSRPRSSDTRRYGRRSVMSLGDPDIQVESSTPARHHTE